MTGSPRTWILPMASVPQTSRTGLGLPVVSYFGLLLWGNVLEFKGDRLPT